MLIYTMTDLQYQVLARKHDGHDNVAVLPRHGCQGPLQKRPIHHRFGGFHFGMSLHSDFQYQYSAGNAYSGVLEMQVQL